MKLISNFVVVKTLITMGYIKRKPKKCVDCGEMRIIFGRNLCNSCYRINNVKPIKKVSDKLKSNLEKYYEVRDKYLSENPKCEANIECKGKNTATDIHHKKGRIGKMLTDVKFFMAVCRDCHTWIHDNDAKARELGFLLSKNGKD